MTIAEISRKLPVTTSLPTLGGQSRFTVVNRGGAVTIINSSGTAHVLDEALLGAVVRRYGTLPVDRRLMAGDYVDPNWPTCRNRIFAPYVARLVDDLQ